MAERLGILFLHHEDNGVVRNNLASVRRHNPRATIVTMSAGQPLPGGYSIESTPAIQKLHAAKPNRSGDWLVCSWFSQRREKCTKWWIIDWDVYCTMSVREYYRPVWNFPLVAASVRMPFREPEWEWFRCIKDLPPKYQNFAMGAVPSLYLVADYALQKICATMLARPFLAGNAELRFCTVANWCGFPPCGYSPPNDYIMWLEWTKTLPKRKSIFHPVKFLVRSRR